MNIGKFLVQGSDVVRSRRCFRTGSRTLLGPYSQMLDLGGAPSSMNSKASTARLNLNKNCHLQAVVFDFDILTRSVETSRPEAQPKGAVKTKKHPLPNPLDFKPDLDRVKQVAELLKVDLSGKPKQAPVDQPFTDDLSLLTGESSTADHAKKNATKEAMASSLPGGDDIRAKYASKLKAAGLGISTVDRVKDDEGRGDASSHFAARAHATTDSRWMAATGTGKLLNYLAQRSMKLALVAIPVDEAHNDGPTDAQLKEAKQMDDFCSQLKIEFSSILKQDGTFTIDAMVERIIRELLQPNDLPATSMISPDRCLWVSDRDDYLRAAKDAGMMTVRIRPANARRGNVSTHYTVATVPDTSTVIDEINGISFSSVLQQGA
jgi:hypothetical protein